MARAFTRSTRMKKQWLNIPNNISDLSASATFIASGSLVFDSDVRTIMRMIGEIVVTPSTDLVDTEAALFTFGIGLFNAEAVVAGAASLSSPSGDPDYPWLWWYSTVLVAGPGGDLGELAQGALTNRIPFDVKSRRIVRPNETLVMVGNFSQTSGSADYHVGVAHTRVLLALS